VFYFLRYDSFEFGDLPNLIIALKV